MNIYLYYHALGLFESNTIYRINDSIEGIDIVSNSPIIDHEDYVNGTVEDVIGILRTGEYH